MRTSVDVHNFLLEREVPHELVPVRGRLRSPATVAAVLGLPPDHVGRVVLFEGGDSLVAAIMRSDRTADPHLVARAAGVDEVSEVLPDRATELTEFLSEALPPVALPRGTGAVMDEALGRQEVLYFPGGEISTLLKIRAADLVRVTEATVAPLAA
ncbi:MAG: aminoacyl-tRNA deacylase [Actinomycetota bacterium]